ncbi:membrane-associated progesterone receptor component 2-like protein [Sarcoptes scabiei]|uniref:Membrane-associated progesterone receptor component 2-like protein n=1 Tax=Sarcoptes scabiei TaxID=52283 RepID=A0A132A4N6_SARSC|nr:membrane-associated progesterone receptor component 2-like protein [Sarcoptes scabiei]
MKSTNENVVTAGSVLDALNLTNTILALLIIYVLYKVFGPRKKSEEVRRLVIPDPLPKHDMTLEELRKYDGKGPDKRICIAILGRVYDCTKGYDYYGPDGAYSTFAGRDASRALAKFDVMAVKDEWDDITDLSPSEMSSVTEWNEQFQEKYDYVGRLVRSEEEILDKADYDEDFSNDEDNKKQGKCSTDDDIELINSEESSSNEGVTQSRSKKVSFNDASRNKKSSDSSEEIEVLEN